MKKISVFMLSLTMIFVFATAAWGVSFGARAAGMGGAFTAVADDCSAVYWNPAGITQLKVLTITPGVGLLGTQEEIDKFIDLMNDPTYPPVLPESLNLGSSAYLGVTTKFVGVNAFLDANILLYQDSKLDKMYTEMNGYGIGTIALPLGPLAIGGNVKIVDSRYSRMVVPDTAYIDPANLTADDIIFLSDPSNNYTTSATGQGLAFDAGVLFSLTDILKIGYTARNLYSNVNWNGSTTKYQYDPVNQTYSPAPGYPQEFTKSGPLPSTYCLGFALRPSDSSLIAFDIETIANPYDPDFNLKIYHAGIEQLLLAKILALRLGAFTTPGEEIGYSAGLGFKLGPVLIDGALTRVGENLGFYATAGFKF